MKILDILINAEKLEHPNEDHILRLSTEDVRLIGAAVGMPEAFEETDNAGTGASHSPLVRVKQRVSKIRAFAATRG